MALLVCLFTIMALSNMSNIEIGNQKVQTVVPSVPSVYKDVYKQLMKGSKDEDVKTISDTGTAFTLKSSAFNENGYFPGEYTCLDGSTGGVSPQLYWVYPPVESAQFMIVMWSHHAGYISTSFTHTSPLISPYYMTPFTTSFQFMIGMWSHHAGHISIPLSHTSSPLPSPLILLTIISSLY